MRRWETLTALAAVILASLGSIRAIPGHFVLTMFAVVLIAIVGLSRLLEAMKTKPKSDGSFDPAERAKMIREQRTKRR
jgi:hypothetical protein